MAKHDLALRLLRAEYSKACRRSEDNLGRRNWLRDAINYDQSKGRTPDRGHVKEFEILNAELKILNADTESLLSSIYLLELHNV